MPLIKSDIQSENVVLDKTNTLILDIEKTRELSLEQEKNFLGLTYKQIEELKGQYKTNDLLKKVFENAELNWENIKKTIDSVEIFYEIIWSRTHLELMFLTKYYVKKIQNPNSFEILYKNNEKFEHWYKNNVEYVLLDKLKSFYIKACYFYANIAPINIFEKDFNYKSKEAIEVIEDVYLEDFKYYLESEWNKAYNYYNDVFKIAQERKRKTILYD